MKGTTTVEIKILYLYHDLMNLYGDNGNIRCFEKNLSMQPQVGVSVDKKSIGDEIDFSQYSFIYIGSGTERNRNTALAHLLQYKRSLCEFIESGKPLLLTGNSIEMLGSAITDKKGEVHEALGLFNFNTAEGNSRDMLDVVAECELTSDKIIGFINKSSQISGDISPLFTISKGAGNNKESSGEGFFYKNLFATHLIGPIAIKNPHFALFIMSKILNASPVDTFSENSKKAYKISLEALTR